MEIISNMFKAVDNLGQTFVQNGYEALATEFSQVIYFMLVIYLAWFGYQIWFGRVSASGGEISARIFRLAFAVMLATNWPLFADYVYKIIQDVPNGVSDVLISKMSGTGVAADHTGITALLDKIYEAAGTAYEKFSNDGSYILGPIMAVVIMILVGIFLAIAIAIIMAAKVLLFITLALAPVFIILAIFGYTFRFLEGWINTVVSLFLMQIFVFVFLAFYYSMFNASVAALGGEATFSKVFPFVLMCFVGMFSLTYVPQVVSTIAGGQFAGFSGALGASWNSLKKGAARTYAGGRTTWRTAQGSRAATRAVALGHGVSGARRAFVNQLRDKRPQYRI